MNDKDNPLVFPRAKQRVFHPQWGSATVALVAKTPSNEIQVAVLRDDGPPWSGSMAEFLKAWLPVDVSIKRGRRTRALKQWVREDRVILCGHSIPGVIMTGRTPDGMKVVTVLGDVRLPRADWRFLVTAFTSHQADTWIKNGMNKEGGEHENA